MSDTDERRAGSVILKDLALFNKAAVLFELRLEPAILAAISERAGDWLKKGDWKGQPDIFEDFVWVCPSEWKKGDEQPIAKFNFFRRPGVESASYDVADMCGVGQTDWGFRFEVEYSWFGGKAAWATACKRMGGLIDEVVKKGWTSLGKGVFFRPMKLRAELLANAWESEDWSKALDPLEQALDGLVADKNVFDKIILAGEPKTELAAD